MAWTNKTKTASISTNGTKISTESPSEKILTPDLCQIIVGQYEDQILIFKAANSDWILKTKI
jgi:hypothetical protein